MTTSYRQLLVHLDSSAHSGVRLGIARRLAQAQGAQLTALYAATASFVGSPYSPVTALDLVAGVLEADETRRDRARADFERAMQEPGVQVGWSEAFAAPTMEAVVRQALYADLLVLGQQEPSVQVSDVPADFTESLIAASGKPALVVPYVDEPATLGETIAIAWKETREAARVVEASLPLLQRARAVHVLSWGTSSPGVEGARLDLASYLKLHQVHPEWHPQGEETSLLGERLLSRAFDLGADLLVMGCYGHSRAREWILGGTSRTVLRSMTLPVLMAH